MTIPESTAEVPVAQDRHHVRISFDSRDFTSDDLDDLLYELRAHGPQKPNYSERATLVTPNGSRKVESVVTLFIPCPHGDPMKAAAFALGVIGRALDVLERTCEHVHVQTTVAPPRPKEAT